MSRNRTNWLDITVDKKKSSFKVGKARNTTSKKKEEKNIRRKN